MAKAPHSPPGAWPPIPAPAPSVKSYEKYCSALLMLAEHNSGHLAVVKAKSCAEEREEL